ncbi:MAG: tRNA pseudouridine(38-40) synthase TruA [Actinomycetota bacterium]|nr:tRNA pseudouridine(38-40) synthase TruA [Actinomycetota bacterium]
MRLRFDVAYDGTDFCGWAVQPGQRSVQGTLTQGLARVLRLPAEQLSLVVAGRTDAGVHACGQVCHVDLPRGLWPALPGGGGADPVVFLLRRLAGILPADVRVRAVAQAPPGFDARFAALRRHYAYRICDDPTGVPPLRRRDVLALRPRAGRLDLGAMREASSALLGLRDFSAFCKRREGATSVRTLLHFLWERDAEGLVVARVSADAFCHSMVRALVGALVPVGDHRRDVGWPARVQAAGLRDPGVVVMPAHGLELVRVDYPPDHLLRARVRQSRAVRTLPCS